MSRRAAATSAACVACACALLLSAWGNSACSSGKMPPPPGEGSGSDADDAATQDGAPRDGGGQRDSEAGAADASDAAQPSPPCADAGAGTREGGVGTCDLVYDYGCGYDGSVTSYRIDCNCPAGACTCSAGGNIVGGTAYAGCPSCAPADLASVAKACGVPR